MLNSGDLTGDAFNMPIYVPFGDVQYLGNNTSFQQIEINAGTLASGTLNLNLIGTNTSKLSYIFPGGFTVASGATLDVGPNVPVIIQPSQTFSDNGKVSFAPGDTVTLNGARCYSTQQIAVAGTLTANDTTFNSNNTGTSILALNSGGDLIASTSTIDLTSLALNSGSAATLTSMFFGINSRSTATPRSPFPETTSAT